MSTSRAPRHLAIVLHAHLPFVRHPEHDDFLEEDWLYEAISETYLPLLQVFDRLAQEQIAFRLTLTLTPTLVSMLRDELLMSRYRKRLDRLCELADKERERTSGDPTFGPLAKMYQERFAQLRSDFHDRYRGDLVAAFRRHQDEGRLELITSSATHAFLPLMQLRPEAARAQLSLACNHYRQHFGKDPAGIWLPECGYYPGLERLLADENLRFFFVDTHALAFGDPAPRFGVHAPVFTQAGVAAFGRDPESSVQVWSAEQGYPGDVWYREFYRDIGWDLDLKYVKPYVQPSGERKNTGIKYYRITGGEGPKAPYDPAKAHDRAVAHASDFLRSRVQQLDDLSSRMGDHAPIVVAPYDAELFGHWWFEGPVFLEAFLREAATMKDALVLSTPSDYLRAHPSQQLCTPAQSSWGERGYAGMWLDESNDWIYPHLQRCADAMVELAKAHPEPTDLERRALNQAARELLLAQSSDWAFIMKTGTMVDYAVRRTRDHLMRFQRLEAELGQRRIDPLWLSTLEAQDNLFPELDYRVYLPAR